MKCNKCGQEFGKGETCQNCGADKVSALGEFSGYESEKREPVLGPMKSSEKGNQTYFPSSPNAICPFCGEIIPADAEYCPYCRKALKTKCLKCNKLFPSQFPSCPHCGTNQQEYKEKKPDIVFLNASGGGDKIEVSWGAKNVYSCRIQLYIEDRFYNGTTYVLTDHLSGIGSTTLTIGSYEFNWCLQDIVNSHFINRHKYNVHLTLWAIYYYDDGKEHQFGRDTSTFQIYIPTLFGSASISYFHYKFNIYEKSQ